jgi:hypothetical protein
MAPTARWRRILRIAAFTVGVLLLGTVALVRMQQQILRWRAERLLSDIRGLQMGKSTWAEAQKIMTRWGAWGRYDGSCTQEKCSYKITLQSIECPLCVYRPVQILVSLGTRDAWIEANFEVIDGIVWGKDFAVVLSVADGVFRHDWGYGLLASAHTVWRTAEFNRYVSLDHPDYIVGRPGACESCEKVYSRFTPFVDPSTAQNLMDFNLDCVTRFFQCRDQIDIMPRVWRQVQAEKTQLVAARNALQGPYYPPTPPPEFLGRDRANIVIAEVVSTRSEARPDGHVLYATFRLDQRLKRAAFWSPEQLEEEYSREELTSVGKNDKSRLITSGRKVILAFDTPSEIALQHMIDLGDYEVLPLTEENLAAIRKGMRLDIFPATAHRFP